MYSQKPDTGRDDNVLLDAIAMNRLLDDTATLLVSRVCDPYRVIEHKGSVVALQLPRKLPQEICLQIREWPSGWHGTPLHSALSIMQYGLRAPGTVLPHGRVIRVSPDHVQTGIFHNGVENWAQGIFLAPSITYASMDSFTSPGANIEAQKWCVVMNARCDPNVATAHAETKFKNYFGLAGEPVVRKWRVASGGERLDLQTLEEAEEHSVNSACVVTATLIVSRDFLKRAALDMSYNELQNLLDCKL
jgi:hypothetical protein